mmetsp:Transcript_25481/g.67270  ORF Transcript_25481/g.67270 Transcript_25481/m.67270 type:complete len:209 (+) Transcript_25481:1163-1789(+)
MAPPLVVEDKGVSEGILATGNALQSAAQRALGRRGIEVWPVEVFVAQGALGRPLIRVQARRARKALCRTRLWLMGTMWTQDAKGRSLCRLMGSWRAFDRFASPGSWRVCSSWTGAACCFARAANVRVEGPLTADSGRVACATLETVVSFDTGSAAFDALETWLRSKAPGCARRRRRRAQRARVAKRAALAIVSRSEIRPIGPPPSGTR